MRMAGKEEDMAELRAEQMQAIAQTDHLLLLVNPITREEFVLVRKDRYDAMQKWMASLKRRWGDPADDDLIRKP
jgi:hypothetical protein